MKKYCENRKLEKFTCDYCGCISEKPKSELTRNQKLGRKNYCSRSCAIKAANSNRKGKEATQAQKDHLKKICGNRRTENTPFNYIMRSVRNRFKEYNITVEDLKELWNKQSGICPYTGIKLELPTYHSHNIPITKQASLDRIDSSKGYIKGNIQFISTPINYMKSTMTDSEVKSFLKLISPFTATFVTD